VDKILHDTHMKIHGHYFTLPNILLFDPKIYVREDFFNLQKRPSQEKNVGVKHATFRMSCKTSAQKFWIPWTQWKICLQNISL